MILTEAGSPTSERPSQPSEATGNTAPQPPVVPADVARLILERLVEPDPDSRRYFGVSEHHKQDNATVNFFRALGASSPHWNEATLPFRDRYFHVDVRAKVPPRILCATYLLTDHLLNQVNTLRLSLPSAIEPLHPYVSMGLGRHLHRFSKVRHLIIDCFAQLRFTPELFHGLTVGSSIASLRLQGWSEADGDAMGNIPRLLALTAPSLRVLELCDRAPLSVAIVKAVASLRLRVLAFLDGLAVDPLVDQFLATGAGVAPVELDELQLEEPDSSRWDSYTTAYANRLLQGAGPGLRRLVISHRSTNSLSLASAHFPRLRELVWVPGLPPARSSPGLIWLGSAKLPSLSHLTVPADASIQLHIISGHPQGRYPSLRKITLRRRPASSDEERRVLDLDATAFKTIMSWRRVEVHTYGA